MKKQLKVSPKALPILLNIASSRHRYLSSVPNNNESTKHGLASSTQVRHLTRTRPPIWSNLTDKRETTNLRLHDPKAPSHPTSWTRWTQRRARCTRNNLVNFNFFFSPVKLRLLVFRTELLLCPDRTEWIAASQWMQACPDRKLNSYFLSWAIKGNVELIT